jgi:hypothetical protein
MAELQKRNKNSNKGIYGKEGDSHLQLYISQLGKSQQNSSDSPFIEIL